jgi:hypothetical protein
MRLVDYQRFYFSSGPPEERNGSLAQLILDMPYCMIFGVVPPLNVLNEYLNSGGMLGGIRPGIKFKPFEITGIEYDELVACLTFMEVAEERKRHPYLCFKKVIIDEELSARYFPPPSDEELRQAGLDIIIGDRDLDMSRLSSYWSRLVAVKYRWNAIADGA